MNIKAKKSLGQNFLIDKNILNQIVNTVKIYDKEILEIGPGSGNLTSYILHKNPKKFYVVEKDDNLSLLLKKKFNDKIEIINDDILKISEEKISKNKLIVFGNLPYNISTEILSKWIFDIQSKFATHVHPIIPPPAGPAAGPSENAILSFLGTEVLKVTTFQIKGRWNSEAFKAERLSPAGGEANYILSFKNNLN